jgi:peroxiredoxin
MKIRTVIIFSICLLLLAAGCKKSGRFVIKGKITHAEGMEVYLEELMVATTSPVDSTVINRKGEFTLKGKTGFPTFYLLKISDNNFITLLVDSLEKISVEADVANLTRKYSVTGSPGSVLVRELNDRLNTTKHQLDSISSLRALFKGQPDYEQMKIQLDERYKQIIKAQVDYSTNFVSQHPFSMASVLALYQKFDDQNYVVTDLQPLKVAASALHSVFPRSEHVKALYANTLKLLQDERNIKLQQIIQEKGINSPDIVLPDADGKQVALSSLRGKYVLVHFWSAVDKDSRIVNPVLVEVYKQFKNKGFEIYQVSIDKNRFEWVDAIDKDKLSWINVGDMQGSTQAVINYNIQTIPYNYLLDKDGSILAQNLKGPALSQTLSAIIK